MVTDGAGGAEGAGAAPGAPALPGGTSPQWVARSSFANSEIIQNALFILSPNCLQKLEAIQLVQFLELIMCMENTQLYPRM